MYCKDCVHWESHIGTQWDHMQGKSWNTCEAAGWANRGDKIVGDELAIYADASDDTGLEAGLMTGPLFGCIRFLAEDN
jgi:hypothetical protein